MFSANPSISPTRLKSLVVAGTGLDWGVGLGIGLEVGLGGQTRGIGLGGRIGGWTKGQIGGVRCGYKRRGQLTWPHSLLKGTQTACL